MAYPSAESVALLLAAMLRRQGKARGRISEQTFKFIAKRRVVRGAFETDVKSWLDYYEVLFVPLTRGGWALVAKSALEGAPPMTTRDHLREEVRALRNDDFDPAPLIEELGFASNSEEE